MVEENTRPALDLNTLCRLQEQPPLFAPGAEHFWTDPHIARQMLAAHLDPTTDAASRRPETIQRSVAWIVQTLGLRPGNRVLDLGCGPGLYAIRLAQDGLQVTGVDFSQNSILESNGFTIQSLWGDLTGAPYEPTSDWIGVIARR